MFPMERTAKRWKFLIIVGNALLLSGFVVFVRSAGAAPRQPLQSIADAFPFWILGLVFRSIGRVGAYWFHG